MNVAITIPKRAMALAALLLGLVFLSACAPPPPPAIEPPVEAVETEAVVEVEPVVVAELEDGDGAYVQPVVEAAPLGTSWGENISSSIGRVDVSRLTSLPAQTLQLPYSADAPRGKVSNELLLLDRDVRVRVLREDGTPWPIYQVDGQVHLQGEVGERYIVDVTNNTTGGIEVALSVDGVAENTGRPATQWGKGFNLRQGEHWRFEGFRKNDDEVAAFRFSDVADSVAIKRGSGSASDAGLIELRIYRVRFND